MISPDSLDTNVSLTLAVRKVQAEIILGTYTVKVHSRIGRETWAPLWYLCRALDQDGAGHLTLPLSVVQTFLDCSDKSIYRWLQDGKKAGAFRRYKLRAGMMTIYLGSLFATCEKMNFKHWGATAICPLWQVLADLRSLTTGITTQKLQQRSRYAANSKLKPEYRKLYGAPHPNELFGDFGQSSLKPAAGEVPRVLHISESRVFVSKNFTHFGASQNAISLELLIHTRTVRRHQRQLKLHRRQLAQAKIEYHQVNRALENEATEFWAYRGTKTDIGYEVTGNKIQFSDGVPMGAKRKQVNSYQIEANGFEQRFFKVGDTMFISRCNIYREDFQLTTMRAARRKFSRLIKRSTDQSSNYEATGTVTLPQKTRRRVAGTILKYPRTGRDMKDIFENF